MSAPAYTLRWVYNLERAPSSTRAGRNIALACTFPVIAVFAVALRLVIRWKVLKGIQLDDIAVVASVVGYQFSATGSY